MDCIKLTALSGVDVRIVTPGIPDKKWVFYLTRIAKKAIIFLH